MKVVVLMFVLKSFFFFLFASAACTVPVLCLWADIYLFNLDIPEISLTEIVQESVLGGIVFIHFLLAKKWAFMRYCNILIGGFFLSMLIRELDAFFDMVCTAFRRLRFALSRYPLSSYPYATGRLYPYPVVRRDAQWSVGSPGLLPTVWNARVMVRDT